jgi:hypothetical protein
MLWVAILVLTFSTTLEILQDLDETPPRWWLHLIVVRGFEYARDPESYTSDSVATGRAYLAGQVKG